MLSSYLGVLLCGVRAHACKPQVRDVMFLPRDLSACVKSQEMWVPVHSLLSLALRTWGCKWAVRSLL